MINKRDDTMNETKRKIKKNKIYYIIGLVITLYVSWIFINQEIKLSQLHRQEEILNKRASQLRKEEIFLGEEKKRANAPEYIEKVAREQLKMVKPNEIIYIDLKREKDPQKK